MRKVLIIFLSLLFSLTVSANGGTAEVQPQALTIIDAQQHSLSLDDIIPHLLEQRVVFIGEQHDRYDHHLNQLTIIRHLHEQNSDWVIGLEFFQQPFQPYLDAFVSGELNEVDFLRKAEYFERWGFDYRLYRDIFRYARDQKIPMIALNIAQELSRKVAMTGIVGLEDSERGQIPQEIDKSDQTYRQRLQEIFQLHPDAQRQNFENFWEAQLLWDESMAQRAAEYLQAHPAKSMIVLAGGGHIAYGSGIPSRLQRRLAVASMILLPADTRDADLQGADYLLVSAPAELAAAGKMGVMLDLQQGVSAQSVLADSAAQNAGMQDKDRILTISGQPVQSLTDVRLALLDKMPGDVVTLTVQRQSEAGPEELTLQLTLQE
jgi:uncharacterized iron-regulated protein